MEPLARPRGDRVGGELRRERRDQHRAGTAPAAGLPAATSTTAGPIENQESASALSRREGRSSPGETSMRPGGDQGRGDQQRRGAGGSTNRAGTKASWIGIV